MHIKKLLLVALIPLVILFLTFTLAFAEDVTVKGEFGPGVKTKGGKPIYVVNVQRVIDESKAGKASRQTVEAEMKKREAALVAKKQEIDGLKAEVEKQASLLSKDAIEEKRDGLAKKERELTRDIQDQDEEVTKRNGAEIEKIVNQIDGIIADLVKQGQYGFVIEKDPYLVVYVNPEYDLTDKVISLVDKKSKNS